MPIAFKEWAVTVRALAEGEQLITLRKGGIREPGKPFRLAHERFFLYPTFDHKPGDLVRESHQPELRSSRPIGCAFVLGPKSPATLRLPTRAASTRSPPSTCGRPITPRSASV